MRVVRRGLSCDECGGTEFEKDDSGFYTCISCGVQRTVRHVQSHHRTVSRISALSADAHRTAVYCCGAGCCRRRSRSRSTTRPQAPDRAVNFSCSDCQPHPNSKHTLSNVRQQLPVFAAQALHCSQTPRRLSYCHLSLCLSSHSTRLSSPTGNLPLPPPRTMRRPTDRLPTDAARGIGGG